MQSRKTGQEPFPDYFAPMLMQREKKPFNRAEWLFEPKLDGMRCLAFVQNGECTIYSRNGRNLCRTFPQLVQELKAQPDCVLDGEIVAHGMDGNVHFERLQERSLLTNESAVRIADQNNPVSFYAFDILYAAGKLTTSEAFTTRKQILQHQIKPSNRIKLVDHFTDGIELFELCRQHKFEGIIAKRAESVYRPGARTPDWKKIKFTQREQFAIVGYREEEGYLVAKDDRVVGVVQYGLTNKQRDHLRSILVVRSEEKSRKGQTTLWFSESVEVEIEFMEWTSQRYLRFPVFKSILT